MTPSSLLGSWVVGAIIVMSFLFLIAMGLRASRYPKLTHYKRLPHVMRVTGIIRLVAILVGVLLSVGVTFSVAHLQLILSAPILGAVVALTIVASADWILLGRTADAQSSSTATGERFHWRYIGSILPLRILGLTLVILATLIGFSLWAGSKASPGDRSYTTSWSDGGIFGWGIREPFVGSFYTVSLCVVIPFIFIMGALSIIAVVARDEYLPFPKYRAIDRGLRQQTVRIISLLVLLSLGTTLTLVTADIAWVFGSLGHGSPEETRVALISTTAAILSLVITLWTIANLVWLPTIKEDDALLPQEISGRLKSAQEVARLKKIKRRQDMRTQAVAPVRLTPLVPPVLDDNQDWGDTQEGEESPSLQDGESVGENDEPTEQDTESTGGDEKSVAQDVESTDQEDDLDTHESEDIDRADESEESAETDEPREVDEPEDVEQDEQANESDESQVTEETNESEETAEDEQGEQGEQGEEVEQTDESDESDESVVTEETEETDGSEQTKETTESEDMEDVEESGETGEVEESKQTDEFAETEEADDDDSTEPADSIADEDFNDDDPLMRFIEYIERQAARLRDATLHAAKHSGRSLVAYLHKPISPESPDTLDKVETSTRTLLSRWFPPELSLNPLTTQEDDHTLDMTPEAPLIDITQVSLGLLTDQDDLLLETDQTPEDTDSAEQSDEPEEFGDSDSEDNDQSEEIVEEPPEQESEEDSDETPEVSDEEEVSEEEDTVTSEESLNEEISGGPTIEETIVEEETIDETAETEVDETGEITEPDQDLSEDTEGIDAEETEVEPTEETTVDQTEGDLDETEDTDLDETGDTGIGESEDTEVEETEDSEADDTDVEEIEETLGEQTEDDGDEEPEASETNTSVAPDTPPANWFSRMTRFLKTNPAEVAGALLEETGDLPPTHDTTDAPGLPGATDLETTHQQDTDVPEPQDTVQEYPSLSVNWYSRMRGLFHADAVSSEATATEQTLVEEPSTSEPPADETNDQPVHDETRDDQTELTTPDPTDETDPEDPQQPRDQPEDTPQENPTQDNPADESLDEILLGDVLPPLPPPTKKQFRTKKKK